MNKIIPLLIVVKICALMGLQFVKPSTQNPHGDMMKFVTLYVRMPESVQRKLEKSCFDCHSYRTKWPWYGEISPIVYKVKQDVDEGREKLNFSEWGNYDTQTMADKLFDIEKTVVTGKMPPSLYGYFHPEANLTDAEKQLIAEWARSAREEILKK